MTKIFPYDFDKKVKSFNVRFLPNLLNNEKLGDSIITALKEIPSVLSNRKRKSQIYLSYAIINPFDGFNSYVIDSVSIIRYGKNTFHYLSKEFEKSKNPFDLNSEVSYVMEFKVDTRGFQYFEIVDTINSKNNRIYDESHPGKNDKNSIIDFLLKRDKCIESEALNFSDDKFKGEIMESYGDIIRDYRINKVLS